MREEELESLAEELMTASRALVAIAVRSIESTQVEVTVSQHRVLVLLTAHGAQTVGELAQHLGVNPSNATRLCDRLQRLELVRREPSPSDGRSVQVQITAAGARIVESVNARRREEITAILREQPLTQARQAIQALSSFNQAAHERPQRDWTITMF